MVFSICVDSTGSACSWTEVHSSVSVSGGLFDVILGSVNPITDDNFLGEERWLGINVGGEAMPYTRLVSVPYAHRVSTIDGASGGTVHSEVSPAELLLEGNQIDFNHYEDGQSYIDKLDNGPLLFRMGPSYEERLRLDSLGVGIAPEKPFGFAIWDKLSYDGKDLGHYSLGWYLDSWYVGGSTCWMSGFGGVKLFTGGWPRLSITGTGNVGIGTTVPQQELHVASEAGADIFMSSEATSNNWNIGAVGDGTDQLRFAAHDGTFHDVLSLDKSGWVGLGTPAGSVSGHLATYSLSNQLRVVLTKNPNNEERGSIQIYGDNAGRVWSGVLDNNSAATQHFHSNGTKTASIGSGATEAGYVNLYDQSGGLQARMYVDAGGTGYVEADVKSFVSENPDDPTTEIRYACPEGPEAAAYVRGTATLVDGRAVVQLPDHFTAVADLDGITVQLTPHSADSKGLAAIERTTEQITVQELGGGHGNYAFDFSVMCTRKGYQDFQVVVPKRTGARDAPGTFTVPPTPGSK